MRASFAKRIRIIAALFVGVALVIVGKLYVVQVLHGDEYRQRAEDQQVAPTAHQLARGTIYFTGKDGSLISAATLKSGFTVAVLPPQLTDIEAAYEALNRIVPYEHDAFMQKAERERDPYEELGRRYDETVGQAVLAADIDGVRAFRERWRYYPGGTLAGHEVGVVSFGDDGTTQTGRYGLERSYNDVLTRPESGLRINFIAELFTNVGARIFSGAHDSGGDVVTSIEPTVQAYLEDELRAYNSAWNAATVGGIIIEPSTGKIIAMAALPGYDPNDIKNADPNALANPLVERVYEFGSTMKAITMAAALDSGEVTTESTYTDTGTLTIDQKTISNFDGRARGVVPMQEILSQSLNVGIGHIVQKMGPETVRTYFEKFGITEETGIDLPSEASPLVRNLESPRAVEYITAGFGQGVAITPIAMARALATLANKGAVPQPHIGVEVHYPGGIVKDLGWAPPRQALRPESAEQVTTMLVTVVDDALRGGKYKIPELSVAAKTGTAQIANPAGGGYYKDRYLHSFFGYFPAHDARFLVFLFAVEPKGAEYASETWTDPFFSITKFLMTYYGVQPDRVPVAPTETL
jgi:cell division protein FtsI/penicillin-binding protein 2